MKYEQSSETNSIPAEAFYAVFKDECDPLSVVQNRTDRHLPED